MLLLFDGRGYPRHAICGKYQQLSLLGLWPRSRLAVFGPQWTTKASFPAEGSFDVTSGLPTVAVFYLAVLNLRPSSPIKLSSPELAFSLGPPATPHWFRWVWAALWLR